MHLTFTYDLGMQSQLILVQGEPPCFALDKSLLAFYVCQIKLMFLHRSFMDAVGQLGIATGFPDSGLPDYL